MFSKTNEYGLHNNTFLSSNMSNIDKGNVNFLPRDIRSIYSLEEPLFDVSSNGRMLATTMDLFC